LRALVGLAINICRAAVGAVPYTLVLPTSCQQCKASSGHRVVNVRVAIEKLEFELWIWACCHAGGQTLGGKVVTPGESDLHDHIKMLQYSYIDANRLIGKQDNIFSGVTSSKDKATIHSLQVCWRNIGNSCICCVFSDLEIFRPVFHHRFHLWDHVEGQSIGKIHYLKRFFGSRPTGLFAYKIQNRRLK